MRSFIITTLLFLSMCAAIALNNGYIRDSAEYITTCVSDEVFEADPEEAIDSLDSFWEKNHPIVGLSVGYKELDRMSDLILDLRTYFEMGNSSEVLRLRVMIRECADEISRLEKFGLENLL